MSQHNETIFARINLDQIDRATYLKNAIDAMNVALSHFPAAPLFKHTDDYVTEAGHQSGDIWCKILLNSDETDRLLCSIYHRMEGFNCWGLTSQIYLHLDRVIPIGPITFTETEWRDINRNTSMYQTLVHWYENMTPKIIV